MLSIKLSRQGRKRLPCYKIRVSEKRTKRDGKYIEEIGFYQTKSKNQDKIVKMNVLRYLYWVSQGSQPTKTVYSIYKNYFNNKENLTEVTNSLEYEKIIPDFFKKRIEKFLNEGKYFH